jgi:hypothetical protein
MEARVVQGGPHSGGHALKGLATLAVEVCPHGLHVPPLGQVQDAAMGVTTTHTTWFGRQGLW